ncbi:MAG: hypothetical protein NT005_08550, partial [Spirochaetes bacterium]|nr:hypothetical protein [Spirochaetota bacterium]
VSTGTFPQAPSPRLEQEREIVEILVAARGPLVPDELFQSDEMHGQGFLPVREPFRLAALPSNGKIDAVDAVDEVKTIRWKAELENLSLLLQHPRILDPVHRAAPKLLKDIVETRGIRGAGIEKDIHVGGEARVAILDDRLAADNEIPYSMLSQQREEIEDISVKECDPHFRRSWRGRRGGGLDP